MLVAAFTKPPCAPLLPPGVRIAEAATQVGALPTLEQRAGLVVQAVRRAGRHLRQEIAPNL